MKTTLPETEEIYTISELNREVKNLLENNFASLWVEGEISNFAAPHSGHWYFSLKDAQAQVKCAVFRPQNRFVNFLPKDGLHVFAKARVSLYEGRGDYQLLIEHLEMAGEGKLRLAFELLKKQLAASGLFDARHKKPLPLIPQRIGIITSPTGAALKDILTVLKRRFPSIPVMIYPALVQGSLSADSLVNAIALANQRKECDVLLLARGGGSLEDLWPFNEEKVAQAIFKSELPIVTGIGHEIDFTIADFVADLRAATPSAAAELITPHQADLINTLNQLKQQFVRHIQQQLHRHQQTLHWLIKQLQQQHPKRRLTERMQQIDLLEMALKHLIQFHLQQKQQQITTLAAKLNTLSPLGTLQRGYAIATRLNDKHLLKKASEVQKGDQIKIKLSEGEIIAVSQ